MKKIVTTEHFNNRPGLLSGVWFTHMRSDPYDPIWHERDVQYLFFMVDGVIYRVQEDPNDGYRSHLRDIVVADQMPIHVWQPAEPVWTFHRHKNSERKAIDWDEYDQNYRDDRCNIVELISTTTDKCVLEFGTDDSDDYYPCFVASFHPENMGINNAKANLLSPY